ncbi:MAG: SGNH/GDSL hydrolase family protein [Candidatus Hydrogenedentes bacterium]|nr:SGNH/GDSL hydrolase family protein [Candidatus Hydrogenedentota bacterium]
MMRRVFLKQTAASAAALIAGPALDAKEAIPVKVRLKCADGRMTWGDQPDTVARKALLAINDVEGAYTIPYIQSSPELPIEIAFTDGRVATCDAALLRDTKQVGMCTLSPSVTRGTLTNVAPGEYMIEVKARDAKGAVIAADLYGPIGVGAVMAAIGDSITEGYYGHGFRADVTHLTAASFPPEAVSKDGRNFPQFAPTTASHLPEVNCFESWMTRLNDELTAVWKHPVFIANEGWGGIASGEYLGRIRGDTNWAERIRFLRPNLWLIHLGVNDERAHVPRETFASNMQQIVQALQKDYGAVPARIFVAKPCFDYFEGAEPILAAYCEEIDKLVTRMKLGAGADFFAGYAKDRARWYGEDPVHPNVEGMNRMADLWRDTLVRALPSGLRE